MQLLYLFADYQILVSGIAVLACWKWGDWRNWTRYYPTILYYILNDIAYALLFFNYPLWELESPLLKTTLSDFVVAMVFFPAAILVYLPHFPRKRLHQGFYIILWASATVIIEKISFMLGYITYHNGWNLWYTALFDILMFSLLALHHKKPLYAWLIGFVSIIIAMLYFRFPYSSLK